MSTVPASSSLGAAIAPGAIERPPRAGDRQQPPAPVVLGRVARMRPHDDHGRAAGEVGPELLAARDQVVTVGDLAPQHGSQECGRRLLRGPLGRAHALDLGGDQRRHQAAASTDRAPLASAHPQLPDGRVGDLELDRRTSSASRISERSSAGERAATARIEADRSIRIRLASSARPAARSTSGRPAPA